MVKVFDSILSTGFILFIKFYQSYISFLLPISCRYKPTCSNYMIESIKEWGTIYGFFLGLKRILRCNPIGSSGYDPIPLKDRDI